MCRIAGIISKIHTKDILRDKVVMMCHAQKRGGPDDEGVYIAESVPLVFGHRRLSIIDLTEKGHQPMSDMNQKVWITFNGEIYNYLSLKEQLLQAGALFTNHTDTEIILQVYLLWGIAGFSKLSGMFAFALHDIEKDLTYLVRDTSGIKPLYYHIIDGELSFASEVKAFEVAGITSATNPDWMIRFLAYGHVPEPDTVLKNVYSLPKGMVLCWDNLRGDYTISRYTPAVSINYITDPNVAQKLIRESLTRAVRRQLVADAPIGVFLSGGIDSSLLTLLANKQKTQPLKTVSLYFEEKAYDESAYQQQILTGVQGEKFSHLVTRQDFEKSFPDIMSDMDMPTTDGINSWFISKYARGNGLKAVLSGIGADELFGGYPSFKRIGFIKYLRALPPVLLRTITDLLGDRYQKTSYLAGRHPLADYLFLRGLFTPGEIARILNCDQQQVYSSLFSDNAAVEPIRNEQERASWYESNLFMQNQLLRDTDVMSMHHGLEVRVPFLDEDFLHTVNSIAPEIRFNTSRPKKILIDSFSGILPAAIWNRPKMGFSFPLQQWMRSNEAICSENNYRGEAAKRIIRNFKNDKVHWSKAFALYQVQKNA